MGWSGPRAFSATCRAFCATGTARFGAKPPCKALRHHDGRYWCGIIEDALEGEQARLIEELAVGTGCSSPLFNTDRDAQIAELKQRS